MFLGRRLHELIAMMHAKVGFQAVRLSLRDDVTMMILTVRYDGSVPTDSVVQQRALLRERLAGLGWEIPTILDAMPEARTCCLPIAAGRSGLGAGDGGGLHTSRRTQDWRATTFN